MTPTGSVTSRPMAIRDQARVVVIGAGIVGCSVAYHLAELGWTDVIVVDQGTLFDTGGSTSHAPGLIYQINPSQAMTEFAKYSIDLSSRLSSNDAPCFYEVGSLEVAWTEARMKDYLRRRGFGRSWGVESHLLSPDETREKVPLLSDKIKGALYVPTDGLGKAVGICEALATLATSLGVEFHGGTEVLDIDVYRGAVTTVTTSRGTVTTENVVCAAGIWGPKIGAMAGVPVPLYPMQHQYVRTRPLEELAGGTAESSQPIMRHQDKALYFRQDRDRYGIGSVDHEPLPLAPEDIPSPTGTSDQPAALPFTAIHFENARQSAAEFIPALANAEFEYQINGMFSFTPDAMPVLGEAPHVRGFWSAKSVWVTHTGGVGKAIAEWMVEGRPSMDLRECDVARFHPHAWTRSYALARGCEQYNEGQLIIHPLFQMETARDERHSPFYPRQKELGAVFHETSGWEMPQWYAANEHLLDRPLPSWTQRSGWEAEFWSPIIPAEHRETRENVAIFDLTPATKIEVAGPGALDFLQRLAANQMDQPIGKVTYTSLLNHTGGIVADLTVTRLDNERFLVVTTIALGLQNLAWLRKHAPQNGSVTITDVTENWCSPCIWGPRSRDLLSTVTDDVLSNEAFPYRAAREIQIGDVRALAIRLSYVGELGWELYAPVDTGRKLWDTLWEAGRPFR